MFADLIKNETNFPYGHLLGRTDYQCVAQQIDLPLRFLSGWTPNATVTARPAVRRIYPEREVRFMFCSVTPEDGGFLFLYIISSINSYVLWLCLSEDPRVPLAEISNIRTARRQVVVVAIQDWTA
jgi:hypothetical protein